MAEKKSAAERIRDIVDGDRKPLVSEIARLEKELAAATAALAAYDRDMAKQLGSLLPAMTAVPPGKAPKKKSAASSGASNGSNKKKASTDDLRDLMTGVLSGKPNITMTELFDLTLDKMGQEGFETRGPKTGRNKTLQEILNQDGRFRVDNGKVSLAAANT